MIEFIIYFILAAALIALGTFVFFYGTRPVPGTKWRRTLSDRWTSTPIGIVLMSQYIAWLAVVTFILITRITGDFPGRQVIALSLYAGVAALFVAAVVVLRRIQRPYELQERSGGEVHDEQDNEPHYS